MNWYQREQLQGQYQEFVSNVAEMINDFVRANFNKEESQINAQRSLRNTLDEYLEYCRRCLFYNDQVSCEEICDFESAWKAVYNKAQELISDPTYADYHFQLSKLSSVRSLVRHS